jgi:hypothetical protein
MNLTEINPKASNFKPEKLKKDWRRYRIEMERRRKKINTLV